MLGLLVSAILYFIICLHNSRLYITNISHLSGNVCKSHNLRCNFVSDSIFGITSGNLPNILRDTYNVCRCVS